MFKNDAYIEGTSHTHSTPKWYYRRSVVIIGTFLIISTVGTAVALLLKFAILSPGKSEQSASITPSSSPSTTRMPSKTSQTTTLASTTQIRTTSQPQSRFESDAS